MLEARESYFHPDMSVAEALTLHPRAKEVFMAFHLGGCGSCGISEFHILKDVCAAYGVDVTVLIDVLEGLMEREPLEDGVPTDSQANATDAKAEHNGRA